VSETVARRITGHKKRSILDRYNIVNEADLREAAEKLNDYQQTGHNPGTIEGLKAELAAVADSQHDDISN
jgi:hypothetical protein